MQPYIEVSCKSSWKVSSLQGLHPLRIQMEGSEVSQRKEELRRALLDLRDRGLHTAAKFAAELLSGIRPPLNPFDGTACSP